MKPTVAIVIPIYNRLSVTKEGLGYITSSIDFYEYSSDSQYSISLIIVDDGSTDGSSQWVADKYPDAVIIKGDGNLWWTGAVNAGIEHCLYTMQDLAGIILQNDDVKVEKHWVHNLMKTVRAHPQSLIGCATAVTENSLLIEYGGRMVHPWFAREEKVNYGTERKSFPPGHVEPSFDLYGRGLYIPVEVFDQIGLFDQKKFIHRGDMDIPLRAKKKGFQLLVSYDAIVYELPQLTYGLDVQEKISFSEACKILTDFRSSSNFKFIRNYSKIATNNTLQYAVFFVSNTFYHLRRITWRLYNNYV